MYWIYIKCLGILFRRLTTTLTGKKYKLKVQFLNFGILIIIDERLVAKHNSKIKHNTWTFIKLITSVSIIHLYFIAHIKSMFYMSRLWKQSFENNELASTLCTICTSLHLLPCISCQYSCTTACNQKSISSLCADILSVGDLNTSTAKKS